MRLEDFFYSKDINNLTAERGAEFCDLVMNCCELKDVLDLVFLKLDESVREGVVEFLEFLKNTKAQDSHLNHTE